MGIGLLGVLAAHDFGFVSTCNLITRTGNTFKTVDRMDKYRGHLYNWYDTRTLEPLLPLYVSTVDSGNFAGHLLILRQGLAALAEESILPRRRGSWGWAHAERAGRGGPCRRGCAGCV